MTTTTTTTIPYAKLILSETNVRKSSSASGLAALAASIAGHGLIQPLIVSPATPKKAKYAVHAGGRRWKAIGALIEAGTLPKDHAVEVKIVENEAAAAREISLAENLLREAMTPADECSAYRAIIADGACEEDVARRYGVTVRHVQGRLRLADLAAPIFAALAAGDITLDIAMAYGSTPDQDRQQTAWARFSTSWQGDNAQAIRRAMAEDSLAANHPVALFIGEDEYTAAGGRIERDLFAAEGEGTWLDAALAQELATKKMTFEAEVATLGTKLGWIKPLLATHVPHSETEQLGGYWPKRTPLTPEAQARLEEIETRLEELQDVVDMHDGTDSPELHDAVTETETLNAEHERLSTSDAIIPDEDRPHVGTFLILNREGQPMLSGGYYTNQRTRRANAGGSGSQHGATPLGGQDNDNRTDQLEAALPRALEEQLAKDRRDILALHVAHDPGLALDLAIFSLARNHAGHIGYDDSGCAIRITDRSEPQGLKDVPVSRAVEDIEQIRTGLPGDWAHHEDSFASFLAFRALDEEARANWLAYAVSQSLKASLLSGAHSNAFQSQLGALIGIDTASHWRPGAERFFDRLKKSQILDVLGQIDPAMPARHITARKGELSSAATRLCSGDVIVEPAIKARALAWIPDQMRFEPEAIDAGETAVPDGADLDNTPVEEEDEDGADGDPQVNDDDLSEAQQVLSRAA